MAQIDEMLLVDKHLDQPLGVPGLDASEELDPAQVGDFADVVHTHPVADLSNATTAAKALLLVSDVVPVRRSAVEFDNAETKAIAGNPTAAPGVLVTAPGAGIIAIPRRIVLIADTEAGEYTGIDADAELSIRWGLGGNRVIYRLEENPGSQVSDLLADGIRVVILGLDPDEFSPADLSDLENKAITLEIENATGALTGGHVDNTLKAFTDYDLLTV